MREEPREIDVALDIALVVMENGGSTVRADRVLMNVLTGFGNHNVSTLWRTDYAGGGQEGLRAVAGDLGL